MAGPLEFGGMVGLRPGSLGSTHGVGAAGSVDSVGWRM